MMVRVPRADKRSIYLKAMKRLQEADSLELSASCDCSQGFSKQRRSKVKS